MSEKSALEHLAEMDAQRADFLQWWHTKHPKKERETVTDMMCKGAAWKTWLAARGVKV